MHVEKMILYVLVMAGVTYLIRMIPLVFFRKKIHSRFLLSFFFYLPFTVLAAMTFPAIFYCIESSPNLLPAVLGTAVAIIASLFNRSLVFVAICAFLTCLITLLLL